jgi:hypothetical protein
MTKRTPPYSPEVRVDSAAVPMVRAPTHPPSQQPGRTGSWRVCRSITSPSTCSKASRVTISGSSGPCRGLAASRPSTRRGVRSKGLKRCCGCVRASALPAAGRCASRTDCSQSVSVSQRLTKCETGVDAAYPAPCARVCDKPMRLTLSTMRRSCQRLALFATG